MGKKLYQNIGKNLITKLLRHYRTLGTISIKIDLSIIGPTRTSFLSTVNTGNVIMLAILMILSRVPTLIATFVGQMGKKLYQNIGKNLITKLLRHHMTLRMISIKNDLTICY